MSRKRPEVVEDKYRLAAEELFRSTRLNGRMSPENVLIVTERYGIKGEEEYLQFYKVMAQRGVQNLDHIVTNGDLGFWGRLAVVELGTRHKVRELGMRARLLFRRD